ncbi:MAG TPA: family 16 glycoside hydrolase, partial [Chitinophagaceae bacterium]|nr:family 16 glycoside hydrolase [Chitinophagaceae bacterium]
MNFNKQVITFTLFTFLFLQGSAQTKTVNITVNPDQVIGKTNDKIYGHFLEHLYHSVSNGVWGETVWNRSFEEQLSSGEWSVSQNTIVADAFGGQPAWQIFGSDVWKNYTIEVDAQISEGMGGIVLYAAGGDILKRNKFKVVLNGNHNRSLLEMTSKYRWQDATKSIDTVAFAQAGIQPNTWAHIKLVCHEKEMKVWIDGKLVFNYSNTAMPKQGTPGLGAENAKVLFKNLKVIAADNSYLLNELPLSARHWYVKGNGFYKLDPAVFLNDKNALHVITNSGINMLYQHHYAIKKGDALKGSFWLKGNGGNVTIRMTKQGKVLAQSVVKANTKGWKAFPVKLLPVENEQDATLEFVTEGKADFYIDQVSLMSSSAIANGGFRTDLLKAVQDLKPSLIRWPGGSFVEHYDFVNGIGPQHQRKGIMRWDDYDPLSFGIDEYMRYCEKTGAEPLIVLPIGYQNYLPYDTSAKSRDYWFQKALDEIEYCLGPTTSKWGALRAKNGHLKPYKIKYWELDNETWKMNPDDYVAAVKRFAPAMRRKYPGITIIACGSGALSNQALALDTAVITKAAEYVDMISIHYYEELNKYQSGINDWKHYVAGLNQMIKSSANPQMKIFWSEWNLTNTDMRTGLYAGALLNELEKDTMIAMATPALWLRHISATGWNNAFINFDHKGYFLAPNYLVMKLWRDHFAPNLISVTGNPDSLNIVAIKTDDGKKVYVKTVNPSSNDISIQINFRNEIKVASFQLVAANAITEKNTIEQPELIAIKNGFIKHQANTIVYILPKWSAGVVTV